jgi:hypothetical protein
MKLAPDQFTRWTIKLILDDAYLFSIPFKNVQTMSTNNTIQSPNSGTENS